MNSYQYNAVTSSGTISAGILDAESEQQARHMLRNQNLSPITIKIVSKTKTYKVKISTQDLAIFTRQLATLLAAGVQISESLQGIIAQNKKHVALITHIHNKILSGHTLSQAMDTASQAFSKLYRATVAAGEQTGHLDLVLEKLADYTEKQQQIKNKIRQALIYPALMISVSILILSFLLTFVVPKIIDVFLDSGQSLPLMTQVLVICSNILQHNSLIILLICIFFSIVIHKSLKNLKIKYHWDKSLLHIPIIKNLIKFSNIARYIHTFSILSTAGVSVLEAMQIALQVINNIVINNALQHAATRIHDGININSALQESGFFDSMVIHLIASGEKSGQLAAMMERAASYLDNSVTQAIDIILTMLEPLIILLMGGVVLFIVLATLLPIFSMEQLVV